MKDIIKITKDFAIESHNSINQKYNGKPYGESHLQFAYNIGEMFIYLIPEDDRDDILAAIWAHDIIEDVTSVTFNDLKKATNERVAELAYVCTNEKGRTRAERANGKYYRGIKRTKYAKFVKLCDRIANVKYSLDTKHRMFKMYQKEQKHFQKSLTDNIFDKIYKLIHLRTESNYNDMWIYLNSLINEK